MKKQVSGIIFLLLAATLVGCQSPGRNPAGVYGTTGTYGTDGEYGMSGMSGILPMANRFTGGNEYRGTFEPVYFAHDSSQVSASERGKIEAIAQYLKQNASNAVIIEGHCDERGSREYNLALGERRALAVRTYLAGLGISAERIQTKSLGEEMPASLEHNESAWNQNRRGEFVLYY